MLRWIARCTMISFQVTWRAAAPPTRRQQRLPCSKHLAAMMESTWLPLFEVDQHVAVVVGGGADLGGMSYEFLC